MKIRFKRYKLGLALLFLVTIISISLFNKTNDSKVFVPKIDKKNRAAEIIKMHEFQFNRLKDPKTNTIPEDIRSKELQFAKEISRSSKTQLKTQSIFSNDWKSEGPSNQGGRTKAIMVDIMNENIILAASAGGGVWRSENGGTSWVQTTDPSLLQNVNCLTQDTRPGKTNIWYYGTGEYISGLYPQGNVLDRFLGDGIYKSVDNGKTWSPLTGTIVNSPGRFKSAFQFVWDIKVDPAYLNFDRLYAATYGGTWISDNGGTSWNFAVYEPGHVLTSPAYSSISVNKRGTNYAALSSGLSSGIYVTENGSFWADITPSFWPARVNRIETALSESNPDILYVLADTPGAGKPGAEGGSFTSLWRYNDISQLWEDLSDKLPNYVAIAGGFNTQGGYDLFIEVKPDDENFVIIGGTNLYRTKDGFATQISTADWIGGYSNTTGDYSSYPNHHADQHNMFFSYTNPKIAFSAHDGGISKTLDITADNVVWTFLNSEYVTTQFWNVAIEHKTSGDPLILGGMQDNGTMLDALPGTKSNWEKYGGGDGAYSAISDGGKYRYVSSQNGVIYRMSEFLEWAYIKPADVEESDFLFITPFILDPNNTDVMFLLAGNEVLRNSNLTEIPLYDSNPTSKNWSFMDGFVSGYRATALAMSWNSPNLLYVADNDGKVYRIDDASNITSEFRDISGSNFPNGYISSIAADPSDGNNILVAFSNYQILSLFSSTNGGQSWSEVGGNLEQNSDGTGNGPSIRNVKILPTPDGQVYFAGTSIGLFSTKSLNGSNTIWELEAPETIGNVVIESIDVRQADGKVVAGTFGKGVFSASLIVTDVSEDQLTPQIFYLSQNYPNPFNPSTQIKYSVPESGFVNLSVFNSLGEKVADLVNDNKTAGSYSVSFNAQNFASGVYMYRLESQEYAVTKKMILMK